MNGQVVYLVCETGAIDPQTGQCTSVGYVSAPTMIPALSAGAGAAIASAILACWALAWVFRHV